MHIRLAFGLPLMCLFVGLIVFLTARPGARGSGRQLAQPPVTTAPAPIPTVTPVADEVVGPSEAVTEGVLLNDPLELVVADERGLRILDLETGAQSIVDPSPDLRSLHDVGTDVVVVDQGRARLVTGQGEQSGLGAAQRLLSSDIATRVWLVDAGSASEVEPSGTVTRGPFPIPSGLEPRYSTRLWLVGDSADGVVGVSTTDGRSEQLAAGQLLAARGDTLVWVDCLSGQLGTCQIVITDLVERVDRPLELASAVDYGIATISPDETQLALSGFDADGAPAVILVNLVSDDTLTVVSTATQPDWYDISEPWSPDSSWILWRGFDTSETLWAHRLGDVEAQQIAIPLPGEVNDAIVRNKR